MNYFAVIDEYSVKSACQSLTEHSLPSKFVHQLENGKDNAPDKKNRLFL